MSSIKLLTWWAGLKRNPELWLPDSDLLHFELQMNGMLVPDLHVFLPTCFIPTCPTEEWKLLNTGKRSKLIVLLPMPQDQSVPLGLEWMISVCQCKRLCNVWIVVQRTSSSGSRRVSWAESMRPGLCLLLNKTGPGSELKHCTAAHPHYSAARQCPCIAWSC